MKIRGETKWAALHLFSFATINQVAFLKNIQASFRVNRDAGIVIDGEFAG